MPESAAFIGIPGMEMFYVLLPGITAFLLNLVLVLLTTCVSMYLCLREFSVRNWLLAIVVFTFASLLFYSINILPSMDTPLVVFAVMLVIFDERVWMPLGLILINGVDRSTL